MSARIAAVDCIVCWSPPLSRRDWQNEIHVGSMELASREDWLKNFECRAGACDDNWKNLTPLRRTLLIFVAFNSVVRDHIDPRAAHSEFMRIKEYALAVYDGDLT